MLDVVSSSKVLKIGPDHCTCATRERMSWPMRLRNKVNNMGALSSRTCWWAIHSTGKRVIYWTHASLRMMSGAVTNSNNSKNASARNSLKSRSTSISMESDFSNHSRRVARTESRDGAERCLLMHWRVVYVCTISGASVTSSRLNVCTSARSSRAGFSLCTNCTKT